VTICKTEKLPMRKTLEQTLDPSRPALRVTEPSPLWPLKDTTSGSVRDGRSEVPSSLSMLSATASIKRLPAGLKRGNSTQGLAVSLAAAIAALMDPFRPYNLRARPWHRLNVRQFKRGREGNLAMACRGSVVAMAIATTDFTVFDVDLHPFGAGLPWKSTPSPSLLLRPWTQEYR
jgi:hypothetical protein